MRMEFPSFYLMPHGIFAPLSLFYFFLPSTSCAIRTALTWEVTQKGKNRSTRFPLYELIELRQLYELARTYTLNAGVSISTR